MSAEINIEERDERDPKEHRLFHYTPALEYLEDMLLNGLWPRYCEEDFEWLIGEPVTLAFPMLCFCDIPLGAAFTHRGRYGNYAIGFSKNLADELDINPIWYVQPGSSIYNHLKNNLKTNPRFDLNALRDHPLRAALAFIKPTTASQNDRSARAGTIEVFPADEEMEWRHTPIALVYDWLQSADRGFVNVKHHEISQRSRLKFRFDQVEIILLPTSEEAVRFEMMFPKLKGKVHIWSDRC